MILSQMLKEDDNRFCVDCDTKSPRWASWNLGIFICIRCAGFHRNLGVHISKVKSVNLDSWTAEQIASMQAMGNNRGRAVYEANMPAGFRRSQTDSALETFIRSKYEQRKWIAKDWIPPEITVSSDLIESESNQRRHEPPPSDSRQVEKNAQNNIPKLKPFSAPLSANNPVRQQATDRPSPTAPSSITSTPAAIPSQNLPDLLGLDEPTFPNPSHSTLQSVQVFSTKPTDPLHDLFTTPSVTVNETSSAAATAFSKDLETAFTASNPTSTGGMMSNDRIMALFKAPQAATGTSIAPPVHPNAPGGFVQPAAQQHHLFAHQKSASFGSNLYQQSANFAPHPRFPVQQGSPYAVRPTMNPIHHNNAHGISTPTLQSPASSFTPDQLTNQFSQFVPFANTKGNTSASTLITGMPTRPVTEYMPASADLLWQ